jgi:hypothetical protein
MFFPIIYIHLCNSADEKFQFTFVENINQILGDEFIESLCKVLELFFNSFLDTPIRDKAACEYNLPGGVILHIFFLVFVGDCDILTIRF